MAYKHGVYVAEQGTSIVAPVTATAGLQVVIGTAPINRASDPYHLDAVPMARGLLVPLDKFKDTRVALENPKSSAGILFAAVKAALN